MCGFCGCSLKRSQCPIKPNRVRGIRMASFHEKVERLKSAISKAEMFVNQGGDPQGPEAGGVRAEVVDAWDEFQKEFVDASVQMDA
jgi:hypothetical protein